MARALALLSNRVGMGNRLRNYGDKIYRALGYISWYGSIGSEARVYDCLVLMGEYLPLADSGRLRSCRLPREVWALKNVRNSL